MTTQYIEICSSRRNRNIWPTNSDFDIDISYAMKDKKTALDPVCLSAPTQYWNANFNYNGAVSVLLTIDDLNSEGKIAYITAIDANYLRPETNFYDGCVLVIETASAKYKRRIVYYKLISSGATRQAVVRLDIAIPENITITSVYIQNPATNDTSSASVAPNIFIPFGEDVENYYITNKLQDINDQEISSINSYDEFTHLSLLSSNTVSNWNASNNKNFAFRTEMPYKYGTCVAPTLYTIYLTDDMFRPTDDSYMYTGDFFRFLPSTLPTNGIPMIAPYGNMCRVKTVNFKDMYMNPVQLTNTIIYNGTETLSIGDILYIKDANPTIYTITNIVGNTITTAEFIFGGGTDFLTSLRKVVFSTSLTATPVGEFRYEFLPFSYDNVSPLFQNIIQYKSDSCYEIQLLNLVLPNAPIITGKGGIISLYPYVYVELSCKSVQNMRSISSNNPVSYKMLFRVIISDTNTPDKARFIKLNSSGMVQRIKFNPTDTLHFSVRLPDGDLFDVDLPEYYSPLQPNALKQISAIFSLKKL